MSQAAMQTKSANTEDMQWLCPAGEVGTGADAEQAKHHIKWTMKDEVNRLQAASEQQRKEVLGAQGRWF